VSDDIDVLLMLAFDGLGTDPALSELEDRLRALAAGLVGTDSLRRATIRAAAIRRLEQLGVRAPARLVDAALAGVGDPSTDGRPGQLIVFEEPELWPDPVDAAVLLEEVAETYRRFVVLPEGGREALALWVAFTHTLEAFAVAPVMILSSPVPRCGKTTTEEITAALVRRPLPASNITPAALFRAVDKYAPTVLVDEADTFLRQNVELAGVLNSGHTRATAFVIRVVGDEHEPRTFSTWGARMLALIGRVPFPTLEDRAIVLPLRRRAPEERVERLRHSQLPALLAPIRRRLVRWAADALPGLYALDPEVPEGLDDRQADNWRPLLAISDVAGGPWPARAREVARLLCGLRPEEQSAGVAVLADIRSLFGVAGLKEIPTETILRELVKMEERPWPTWGGMPITARQLAGLLRPFGIYSKTIRVGDKTPKGYVLEHLQDAFSRYLAPSDPQPAQHPNDDAELPGIFDSQQWPRVADGKSGLGASEESDVGDVAAEKPGTATKGIGSPGRDELPAWVTEDDP